MNYEAIHRRLSCFLAGVATRSQNAKSRARASALAAGFLLAAELVDQPETMLPKAASLEIEAATLEADGASAAAEHLRVAARALRLAHSKVT
jgi:hypothetical protein